MKISILATIFAVAASVSANPVIIKPKITNVNVNVAKNTLTVKCGNNEAIFCCDKFANCKALDGSAGTTCTGGITTCCEQNADSNALQVCIGSVSIGSGSINISNN